MLSVRQLFKAASLTASLTKVALLSAILFLTSCAATQTMLSKKDLDVQTRTSTSIFVEPVARPKRTIYLDVRSGVMEFDKREFKKLVREQFTSSDTGYQIIDDPDKAQFRMIAYVLNLEKASPTAAQQALGQGFQGGAISAGAAAAVATGSGYRGIAGGALVGGAAELITGSLVKDITYMLVCDIQITEKAADGVIIRRDSQVDSKVSDSGTTRQTYSEATDRKEYRTRIVTTANQANLKLPAAQPLMFKKTAYAMAGFF